MRLVEIFRHLKEINIPGNSQKKMEKKHWMICTEFLKAIEENNHNRVNNILDTGFDIDTHLKIQRTAISICASNGWYEMAHLLMTRGCSLSLKTSKGETPLHLAVLRSEYDLVKLLLENRADVTSIDHMRRTVLHYACEMGCFNVAALLAEHSSPAIINMKDNSCNTPLIYACLNGCTALISCLLTKGAEVNVENSEGNSPLLCAMENQKCSTEMVSLLLDAGADIHHTNGANETALLKACQVFSTYSSHNSGRKRRDNPNYREILLLLIERGSNVNAKNRLCETVLHLGVAFQDKIVIRALLNYGADVNATTCLGIVPLVYACKKGPHEILSLLTAAGAKFNFGYYDKYVGKTWPLPQDECNNPCGKFISLILNLLDKLNAHPPTLKNLCRISIRKNLSNIHDCVPSLPLPPSLKRFLLFLDE